MRRHSERHGRKGAQGDRSFRWPGGLSLGLIGAGFEMVGAVEWDPHAGRTYRHNIGDQVYVRDLREFGPRDMERALKKERSIRSKYPSSVKQIWHHVLQLLQIPFLVHHVTFNERESSGQKFVERFLRIVSLFDHFKGFK